jgi:hypothetical protein
MIKVGYYIKHVKACLSMVFFFVFNATFNNILVISWPSVGFLAYDIPWCLIKPGAQWVCADHIVKKIFCTMFPVVAYINFGVPSV